MEDVVYSFVKKFFRQPGLRGGNCASVGIDAYAWYFSWDAVFPKLRGSVIASTFPLIPTLVWHVGAAFGLRDMAWKRLAGRGVFGNPGLLGRVLGAVVGNDAARMEWEWHHLRRSNWLAAFQRPRDHGWLDVLPGCSTSYQPANLRRSVQHCTKNVKSFIKRTRSKTRYRI